MHPTYLTVPPHPTRSRPIHRPAHLRNSGKLANTVVCATELDARGVVRQRRADVERGAVVRSYERTIKAGGMASTVWVVTATVRLTDAERAGQWRRVFAPSPYAWLIVTDHIETDSADVAGPYGASPEQIAALRHGAGAAFQMRDDDSILYYSGRILGTYDGFEPLADYGAPSAGCTIIEYQNDAGEWTRL